MGDVDTDTIHLGSALFTGLPQFEAGNSKNSQPHKSVEKRSKTKIPTGTGPRS
jgi:hypothetical protein